MAKAVGKDKMVVLIRYDFLPAVGEYSATVRNFLGHAQVCGQGESAADAKSALLDQLASIKMHAESPPSIPADEEVELD